MATMYQSYKDVPKGQWRWENFSPREIACKGTGKLLVDEVALDKLQELRDKLGVPLIITSAYRSPEHNRKVGGAKNSYHMQGIAFDIRMDNHDPDFFEIAAREVGFRGIGYYVKQGFMHIDLGPERTWGTRFPRTSATRTPVEEEKKTDITQSTTIRAVVAGSGAAAVNAGAAFNSLEGINQTIAIVSIVVVVLALGWILRERIKKWADGIR
jgi:zinc D-Ala-D-Ala carboxypeptidase